MEDRRPTIEILRNTGISDETNREKAPEKLPPRIVATNHLGIAVLSEKGEHRNVVPGFPNRVNIGS